MSATLTIPLKDNKEIAALVADKQPGDPLYGCFSIKSLDDQTLVIRTKEITDKIEDLPKPDEYDEDEDEMPHKDKKGMMDEDEDEEPSSDESDEAIRLASPTGYGDSR